MKSLMPLARLCAMTTLVLATAAHAQTADELSLAQAVALATSADPWIVSSQQRQAALVDEAVAASRLPDPKISLTARNFPVDTFDINQEPMTQLSVGISQTFPRGDSRGLARRQREQLSAQEPLLRVDRQAKAVATVSQLWLDAYSAQESIRLIEQDRALFEQLVDATRSSYTTAMGRTRQQDLIRAQLELIRLQDRLVVLRLQQETAQRKLSEWIGGKAILPLPGRLPENTTAIPLEVLEANAVSDQARFEWISQHPAVLAFDKRIEAMATSIGLARQQYKPEWTLNAQYGYRGSDPLGRGRADLFSIGVTFDLPVFTGKRQDKQVSAAQLRTQALTTDKQLLIRQLMASLATAIAQWRRLGEREALYIQNLLPEMAQQAEAALTAYNNDDGDFAEAVRARIAELDAKLEALSLRVERHQLVARVNYLLTQSNAPHAWPQE